MTSDAGDNPSQALRPDGRPRRRRRRVASVLPTLLTLGNVICGFAAIHYAAMPVQETIEVTLREAARCTREGIRINTFMLDADYGLKHFVEQLTAINRGRAFFTNHESLGDYVLVDFIEHKRQLARGAGRRRPA